MIEENVDFFIIMILIRSIICILCYKIEYQGILVITANSEETIWKVETGKNDGWPILSE